MSGRIEEYDEFYSKDKFNVSDRILKTLVDEAKEVSDEILTDESRRDVDEEVYVYEAK